MIKKSAIFFVTIFICSFARGTSVKYPNVYCVILAGGSGTRLWPISRAKNPKQFLSIYGQQTLLEQAIDRVSTSVPKENIWIGTTKEHEARVQEIVGEKIGRIVVEPGMRNTGPAILLSCFEIYKQDPDASIIFLPSDPFIPTKERFIYFLDRAIEYTLAHDRISLLGLKPTCPATGYGYIEYDDSNKDADVPFVVKKFHEKPVYEVAQRYCSQGNMLWNISMFCAKARVFLEEFENKSPDIFKAVKAYIEGRGKYEDVRAESIDYALMEKSNRVSVFPVDFEWCDVGNVEVFLSLQKEYDALKSKKIEVDSQNNLVSVPNKLVALVGVENLCVIETPDAILITHRDQTEKVRQVVRQLKQLGWDESF